MIKLRQSQMKRQCFTVTLISSFLLWLGISSAAQIIVTTAEDGVSPVPPGSLRAAITAANANANADVITFDQIIFRSKNTIISLVATALPTLIGPGDTIDGTGARVVIDGQNLTALAAAGLRVRASNVTIHALTLKNFIANDAIVVEGTDARPIVIDVIISSNSFFNNRRGVRIDGGLQTSNTTVTADVVNNNLQDNIRGIFIRGNGAGSDGGNTVSVVIDNNVVQAKTVLASDAGSAITIQGGSDIGSNNNVTAVVTNNTVTQVRADGIVVNGCTANATGSNNTVNATITGNNVKSNRKLGLSPSNLNNSGIIIIGASGETADTSFCSLNAISYLVSGNSVSGFKTNNIGVSGGDEGTDSNVVVGSIVENHVSDAIEGRGIQVSGGEGNNHSVSALIIDNVSNNNGIEGINIIAGDGINNVVSVSGLNNNTASGNAGDGIAVRSNVPGVDGGTSVSGNHTDRNGEDGIDIKSTGYVLSNNTASRNTSAGIDAVGNVNGGENKAKQNASCNTPGCF